MKTVRRFSWSKFLLFLLILAVVSCLCLILVYFFEIGPVSSSKSYKTITIEKGDKLYTISSKLKKNNLIKSEFFYKLYLKFNKPSDLIVGDFNLSENMGVEKIIDTLSNEKNRVVNTVRLTFREGINIRQMAKIVEDNTEISSEDFINKVSDKEYIKSIQSNYWFLTDDIYDEKIYYPLEGYLFPDTYEFEKKKVSAEGIIKKMLDNTLSKLDSYKASMEASAYSVHDLFTLSSLIEQEAVTKEDRLAVSSVFYNRLRIGMSLGSDVTTYYAAKKSLTESLTKAELDECNGYNTRCLTMRGLPVGPISNFDVTSMEAAINPSTSDYYYFVADKNKKVYFTKTLNEHNQTVAKLKKDGLWAA